MCSCRSDRYENFVAPVTSPHHHHHSLIQGSWAANWSRRLRATHGSANSHYHYTSLCSALIWVSQPSATCYREACKCLWLKTGPGGQNRSAGGGGGRGGVTERGGGGGDMVVSFSLDLSFVGGNRKWLGSNLDLVPQSERPPGFSHLFQVEFKHLIPNPNNCLFSLFISKFTIAMSSEFRDQSDNVTLARNVDQSERTKMLKGGYVVKLYQIVI